MNDEADMLLLFLQVIFLKKILSFFPFELCGFFLPLKAGPEFDKKFLCVREFSSDSRPIIVVYT